MLKSILLETIGASISSLIFMAILYRYAFKKSSKPLSNTWLTWLIFSTILGTFASGRGGFISRITMNGGNELGLLVYQFLLSFVATSIGAGIIAMIIQLRKDYE